MQQKVFRKQNQGKETYVVFGREVWGRSESGNVRNKINK